LQPRYVGSRHGAACGHRAAAAHPLRGDCGHGASSWEPRPLPQCQALPRRRCLKHTLYFLPTADVKQNVATGANARQCLIGIAAIDRSHDVNAREDGAETVGRPGARTRIRCRRSMMVSPLLRPKRIQRSMRPSSHVSSTRVIGAPSGCGALALDLIVVNCSPLSPSLNWGASSACAYRQTEAHCVGIASSRVTTQRCQRRGLRARLSSAGVCRRAGNTVTWPGSDVDALAPDWTQACRSSTA
jgi:hypothetical protein